MSGTLTADQPKPAEKLPVAVNFRGTQSELEAEAIKSHILSSALTSLQGRPGFNPAALSIVFGLKW